MWSNQENRVRKQVKNPCEARKSKASQNLHKIISTQLLTVLIMRVILQIEQRKRDKEKIFRKFKEFKMITQQIGSSRSRELLKGDMTYVNA